MLSADQMRSLPSFMTNIPDPRRAQGRRHCLPVVLGIAAGAVLCGMNGYKAIADWASSLGQKARARFGCRYKNGRYVVPSESIFRDVLVRIEPNALDNAMQRWNETWGIDDQSLAIDGKTMCNAIDEEGRQTHVMSVVGHQTHTCYTQKKVANLPIVGSDEVKRTNEIGMAIPLLEAIDIKDKDITADALLTQHKLAKYLVEERHAHYHFIVKGNQPTLQKEIAFQFQIRKAPDFVEISPPEHGRIETRKIWCSTALNDYLNFPHVGQVFLIERESIKKNTGKCSHEIAFGVTSRTPEQMTPKQVLNINRGHWSIENSCHYILDWNFDEDRNRIRTGNGPENMTRLRRFAIGTIKLYLKEKESVAQKMRQLNRNIRQVFDYLRMTKNSANSTVVAT